MRLLIRPPQRNAFCVECCPASSILLSCHSCNLPIRLVPGQLRPHRGPNSSFYLQRRMSQSTVLFATKKEETTLETFESFLSHEEQDLAGALQAVQVAVKQIAQHLGGAGLHGLFGKGKSSTSESGRDEPKKLDVIANEVLKSELARSGVVAAMASEEDEDIITIDSVKHPAYVAVFDPLDGSSNLDACIPTGTIIGIYPYTGSGKTAVLQSGKNQVAAAYALYSSATMLVVSTGSGVLGFTLDSNSSKFYLTHKIVVPARGQIYSLNDARQFDWPAGLRTYIDTIRQGKGQTRKQYSARYVCSLVADFHRTLLYGGWAGNPRKHLRLVYEANPLSFIAEQAGGRGSTGTQSILAMRPESLHERIPVFLGSPEDIDELEGYDDVQQLGEVKYSL